LLKAPLPGPPALAQGGQDCARQHHPEHADHTRPADLSADHRRAQLHLPAATQ
jgi:hypothetical protein